MNLIRVSKPMIGKEEVREVVDSLKSGWLTTGPKVEIFEKGLKKYLGVRNVVALSSCTSAFYLLLRALGIKPGDQVITPSLTFTSIGNVIVNLGATPVFVEVDRDTLTLDLLDLERKIGKKTKVIVPVDYAGLPSPVDRVTKLVKGSGIKIIQDAATSFGASYKGKKVGALADYTCFSFYATKNITTGEGGALSTNDDIVAEKVRLLSRLGVNSSAWKRHSSRANWFFEVVEAGLKFSMTDLQGAIGIHQLNKTDGFIEKRQQIARRYYEELSGLEVVRSPYKQFPTEHVWNFYPILVSERISRNKFMSKMEDLGVASSVYYIPLHLHPLFRRSASRGLRLPITERVFSQLATLPLYPGLTEREVDKVISVVRKLSKTLLR